MVTAARVAPKYTMSLVEVVLKLAPVIVTVAPGAAMAGVTDVITGSTGSLRNTETL